MTEPEPMSPPVAEPQQEPVQEEPQTVVTPEPPAPEPAPEPVKEEPPVAVLQPKYGCVDAASGLKIRQHPSRNAASIGNAPNKARVELVRLTGDGSWWEVKYKGIDGYMFSEFVKASETGECGR
ncbi:SH3 domain-containing protein [Seleniivibrio sp.]|uniref:SH3 domain-containing protein n=1 Tax=Seleniivibrio sp. TaxID=2898801 RepID=UPI0025FB790A|nr:SH3 domain-containing protein [Seleniivibrio sp.]MCD8553001.1 SH3 domain-containing protein [Seleniivibrio sp.]